MASSRAIDRIPVGSNGCGTTIKTDQRGGPRPIDGNGDLIARSDIGALEYAPGELSLWLYVPLIAR